MNAEEDLSTVTSPFPEPPAYFKRYTKANLALLGSAVETSQGSYKEEDEQVQFSLLELQPPRTDWIIQEGGWDVFGEHWPIEPIQETLESMGVPELLQRKEGMDRRVILRSLLNTLLRTWKEILDEILKGPGHPDENSEVPTINASERAVEHLRIAAINMHQLLNELRPFQAEEQLAKMMRDYIENRKAKIVDIKSRRPIIEAELAKLELLLSYNDSQEVRSMAVDGVKGEDGGQGNIWDELLEIARKIP